MDPIQAAAAKRRFAYLVAFILATGLFALFRLRGLALTPAAVREAVLAWGMWAPLLFVIAVSARPVVFFPSTLLFVAAGLAFGPLLGSLYAVVGAVVAAVITFWLARLLGRDFVQAHLPARVRKLQEKDWGTPLVFFLNLVPIVPLTAVNYGAGLSQMSLSHFTLAVAAGLTPRIFAYAFFGDSLLAIGSRQFLLAVGILALLVAVPTWLRRRWAA